MYNPYAELKHMHHVARYPSDLDHWVVTSNRSRKLVAAITTSTANHVTEITVALVLGRYVLPLDPIVRPGGMRTALRWAMAQLNNGNLWLKARLALEREARLLGCAEPELLACGHAYNYQYCLALLTSIPGLSENWPKR